MDDKTLTELAAKAAGAEMCLGFGWSPLTDDGDLFRLAVKMRLSIHIDDNLTEVINMDGSIFTEAHFGDSCAATRRAAVRAVAAIAEQQNGGSNGS